MRQSPSLTRRTFTGSIGAVLLGSVAGCVSDSDSEPQTGDDHAHAHQDFPSGPSPEVDVQMFTDDSGHHFDPHVAWVDEGGTVTWTNGSGSHTATAYHPDADKPLRIPEDADAWDSGLLTEQAASFSWTFDTAGVYDYFCAPHEHAGMVGTVVVGQPHLDHQPALEDPQDDLPEEARTVLETLNKQVHDGVEHTH